MVLRGIITVKKIVNLFLILIITFLLYGCNIKKIVVNNEAAKFLSVLYDGSDIDYTYDITIANEFETAKTTSHMIAKTINGNRFYYVESNSGEVSLKQYQLYNYLFTYNEDGLEIETLKESSEEENSLLPKAFSSDKDKYIFKKSKNRYYTHYKLTLYNKYARPFLDGLLGTEFNYEDITMKMDISASNETKDISSVAYQFLFNIHGVDFQVDAVMIINKINEDVEIDIPDEITNIIKNQDVINQGNFEIEIGDFDSRGTILNYKDSIFEILVTDAYSDFDIYEDKFYFINKDENVLHIYDLDTLKEVDSFMFNFTPSKFSVNDGKLIVSINNGNSFRIYDLLTWEYDEHIVANKIDSINIFGNDVIYVTSDSNAAECIIHNLKTDELTYVINSDSKYPIIEVCYNKLDKMIYLNNLYDSSNYFSSMIYYDVANKTILPNSRYTNDSKGLSYDGTFIHFNNLLFKDDKLESIGINSCIIKYSIFGYSDLSTIYHDDIYSVFTGVKDDVVYTFIYLIESNSVIYSFINNTEKVYKHNDSLIMFNFEKSSLIKFNMTE